MNQGREDGEPIDSKNATSSLLELQLLWARRMAFVRTKSNTSVKTTYVRKSNYGRSYSAV